MSNDVFEYLVSWQKVGDAWLRELEMLSRKTSDNAVQNAINIKRELFSEIINEEHDVKELVETMYDREAYYYNRGNLIQGHEAIINTYFFMAKSDFNIILHSDLITQVNSDIAYEIGTWFSGGGQGKYILVWKKQVDMNWKILLDSNY